MRRWLSLTVAVVGLLGLPGRALRAQPPRGTPPEIAAERDALIDKIARGQDYEKSIARFIALQRELFAERDAAKLAEQKEQEQKKRGLEELQALQKTLDYQVAQHCPLRVDPAEAGPPRRVLQLPHSMPPKTKRASRGGSPSFRFGSAA